MTLTEKKEFIYDLITSVQGELMEKVRNVPENWDGHELRQWLADTFLFQVSSNVMKGKRLKEYRNSVVVNNL